MVRTVEQRRPQRDDLAPRRRGPSRRARPPLRTHPVYYLSPRVHRARGKEGTLLARRPSGPGAILHVRSTMRPLVVGESIAVDGACLTVARVTTDGFEADASRETLTRTTLAPLPVGAPVDLERSLTLSARLGGHLVSGHVDDVCTPHPRSRKAPRSVSAFDMRRPLAPLHRPEGLGRRQPASSLTMNDVARGRTFDVTIIPHTARGHFPREPRRRPGRQRRGRPSRAVRRASARGRLAGRAGAEAEQTRGLGPTPSQAASMVDRLKRAG